MADDLRARGGKVDVEALSRELGAPCCWPDAREGEGVDEVLRFLRDRVGALAAGPARAFRRSGQPPVGQPRPRAGGYSAPQPPVWTRRLDSVFLHPSFFGPLIFTAVVVAVFQTIFTAAVR